ncbi:MAG: methyltransferase domain-containing protein [Thermoleophilaceae bacterium]|nr:methyltransferase domain-containing protein [Thermoleophilaceae bacterium]MDQ3240613.1 methyltransferase domain-containing protein [Actinomycetota bacterium]
MNHLDYLSVDIESSLADEKMDLTQLDLDDQSFDCSYCSHVLEHIQDDRAAMSELYRILRPGGWGLLVVPINQETTYENPTIVDPADRLEHFGQADHVRKYGRDFADRLRLVGFLVDEIPYAATLEHGAIARYGLDARELVHFCRKPAAGGGAPEGSSVATGGLQRIVRSSEHESA